MRARRGWVFDPQFVVDPSDATQLSESTVALYDVLKAEALAGKPVAVVFNKRCVRLRVCCVCVCVCVCAHVCCCELVFVCIAVFASVCLRPFV